MNMGLIADLYEVTGEWLALQEMMEDLPEEEEQAFIDTYESINADLDEKIDLIGFISKNIGVRSAGLRGQADAIEHEAERIRHRADVLEHRAEWLVGSLLNVLLTTTPDGKRKTDHFNCSVKKSEETVIDDESLIPAQYIKTTTSTKPMKAEIKKAIKAGKSIPGAHIDEKQKVQMR